MKYVFLLAITVFTWSLIKDDHYHNITPVTGLTSGLVLMSIAGYWIIQALLN